jgi:hypothetical protein
MFLKTLFADETLNYGLLCGAVSITSVGVRKTSASSPSF